MNIFTRIQTFILSIISAFCFFFSIPFYAVGPEIDLSKFELTFEEEFDSEIDWTRWSGHYTYGDKSKVRRGSYWNKYIAYTEDGNLIIPLTYLEEGMGGKGAGWYSAGIDTDHDAPNGFYQKFGYFECRCILPKSSDGWSAFWLMNEGVFNEDGSGRDGTEIDVFESVCYKDCLSNGVSTNLHYDGYGNAHKHMGGKKFLTRKNPYEEYHTYGVEWNEKEYIFYIDGKETFRTDFGGVSQNEEYLILSFELSGEDGIPSGRKNEKAPDEFFIVDYVRVYQYKDLMGYGD